MRNVRKGYATYKWGEESSSRGAEAFNFEPAVAIPFDPIAWTEDEKKGRMRIAFLNGFGGGDWQPREQLTTADAPTLLAPSAAFAPMAAADAPTFLAPSTAIVPT
jgi:hypothetical protein